MLLLLFKYFADSNIKNDSYPFFGDMSQEVFHNKAILVGHMINEGRKIYNGRHACLAKESSLTL